ncbi:MAG: glycosyltransferase [Actinomycetota bacterium]
MKVSLVATVKDAAPFVGEFLDSIEAQTRAPDEVVILDGGSMDGTVEILRERPWVRLLEEPGANISRGRNLAVAKASHDVIAVSDADCVLAPDWLEMILEPLDAGADVSMGLYRPLTSSFFETIAAAVSIKEREEIDPDKYMPSSRSVAFFREVFLDAGGYPEWLDIGEDMFLNHLWRKQGVRMRLAEDAVVYRRPRADLGAYWRQFAAYAEGDARGGMFPQRHAIRFLTYAGLLAAILSRSRALKILALAGGAAYASRPIKRAFRLLPSPSQKTAAVPAVPALMAFNDLAKMTGYVRGLTRSRDRS